MTNSSENEWLRAISGNLEAIHQDLSSMPLPEILEELKEVNKQLARIIGTMQGEKLGD